MEPISREVVSLLSYLLPGFISAWIFYGLTAYPKPSPFERVVQALIFTVIVQLFVNIFQWVFSLFGHHGAGSGIWTKDVVLACSIIISLFIGLMFARLANNDKIHSILRGMKFTKETSHPSEWFGVFSQYKTYVVLHLKDGRRLYGWPEEWPSQPNIGHFSLTEAEWLTEKRTKTERIPLEGVKSILIPANVVVFVEFMVFESEKLSKDKREVQNGRT
jgi:hypothetical protein